MPDFEFYIDIENSAGQKQGNGPITSATGWRYTARMDKAGNFDFAMPASDPKAFAVQKKRVARAYALINGAFVEVGAGIIDHIETQPAADGRIMLHVSGDDLIRELTYRSVLNLKLYNNGAAVSHSTALTATGAYAPAGWTFTPDGSPPNDSIYGYFNGETVLAAMVKIADKSQNHFYRGSGRSLVFSSSFTASGVRAIEASGDLSAETCAIVNLTERIDTYDLITRIYPRGSGNANVQLTLRATNRNAPAGYTLSTANNYIENDSANSTYGRIERQVDFREIGPVDNTDADLQAASNMLFDVALEYLKRNSTELEQATYTLQIAGCSQLLRPMQSIRVVYRDVDSNVDIDANLNILEATWQIDTSGIYTTDLVVSNADRWPPNDVSTIADSITAGHIYQALPQLNANSYVTAYNKNVDEDNIAVFRFRFGAEVTQLQQVLFEFQILPFESTVKSVGGSSGGSGDIPTSGPNTNETGTGGNNSTGSGGPTSTSSETPTVGSATPEIGSATPSIGSASLTVSNATPDVGSASLTVSSATPSIGNATPSIGSATPSIGNATPSIGSATPTVGSASPNTGSATPSIGSESLTTASSTPTIGSTTPTIGQTELEAQGREVTTNGTGLETGNPEGGDIVSGGQHGHGVVVFPGVGIHGNVTLHNLGGGNYEFRNNGIGSAVQPNAATLGGNHTHDVDSHTHSIDFHTHAISHHTHTIASHNHTIASHTHTLSAHTHTIASHTHTVASHSHTTTAHTHTIAAHSHTIASHSHTIAAHSHTIASHSHTIAAHSHTIASHSHTIAAHSHTIASHTHTMSAHTHTIAAHTHTLSAHTHSMEQHTHSLNNHTHDLSESITAIYGIFREEEENTFVIGNLQYQVNSGGWATLNSAVDAGDGWYQLDITDLVMDATTFRPLATNNLLEIRGLMNINDIVHALGNTIVSTEAPHGLEAGDVVTIEGTTNYDGEYEIQFVTNPSAFIIPHDDMGNEFSSPGTITIDKTATIDAQLSVRNTIQAIAYT